MSILTNIDNIPLFSTVQEALDWSSDNNTSGWHSHYHLGQQGYMGGPLHSQHVVFTSIQGAIITPVIQPIVVAEEPIVIMPVVNVSTSSGTSSGASSGSSSGSSGGASGGSSGGGGGGY